MRIDEITQSPDEKVIEFITQHCKPYLDEVDGISKALGDLALYRGVSMFKFDEGEYARIVPVNQNRRPTNTSAVAHQAVDDWFQAKFGIRFRQSSVFCTGNLGDAQSYAGTSGTTAIVMPVGDYDYCWSPDVGDLYIELQRNKGYSLSALMDINHYKCNEDIIAAIQSDNEIMLHCQSVMLVNPDWPALYRGIR